MELWHIALFCLPAVLTVAFLSWALRSDAADKLRAVVPPPAPPVSRAAPWRSVSVPAPHRLPHIGHCEEPARRKRAPLTAWETRPPGTLYAKPEQYSRFLRGYLAGGGKITHVYDRRFADMLFAWQDLDLPLLLGSAALSIIVAEGVQVTFPDGPGHSRLYYMDGFRVQGGIVPMFSDLTL